MAADPVTRRILIVDDDAAIRYLLAWPLRKAGHAVEEVGDGQAAIQQIDTSPYDVVLLDVGLPGGVNGLDVLAHARAAAAPPIVIMMTADDTEETFLAAVRGQAYRFMRKPFPPGAMVEAVNEALQSPASAALSIEVLSARPEWIELVVPCVLEMTDRVEQFVMQLDAHLPESVRQSVAQAFRELMNNAIEWGGKLDPNRKVRISCVRGKKMRLYRIADPGEGFDDARLRHAAISNPEDNPVQHAEIREQQGIRPGGLGLLITRSLVDELIYNERRNEVILIKYITD
ncbi:MAG TPA: response regulator [Vicinamibacterales bacterium]|nr:response regulator [Vicinamibacterales bacterium]